ncbi:hypothetical protein [Halosimplex pelagicum]|uniref:Uncharacterized protein n=1 Tax=Halosimplex pelagicum TaxID=869886 RepID=A0A7D5T4D6_9EURY|nr:hypothetical protein [Halosimplex pelagicum]QLH82475.1 hypothetical protein HZS54_12995 [Halosimplex pelagicum]QLH82531.1 hypothetical protein HZS54_13300 [Halosimplex pelagicum]
MTEVLVEPDDTALELRQFVRDNPDVRHEDYRDADDPVREACYVLAEAYFHAMGGTDSGLDIYCLSWSDVDPDYEGTHWFLRDGDAVVDLSLPDPSAGETVPWGSATRRAFITGYEPSNRCERALNALDSDY